MKRNSYWDNFLQTGKVEDYLSARCMSNGEDSSDTKCDLGVDKYAGFSDHYRNDHKDIFCGGLR